MTFVLVVIVALLGGACSSGDDRSEVVAPTQVAEPAFGVHEDLHYDQQKIDLMIRRSQEAGFTWIRFQVLWEGVQDGGPDSYRWDAYDVAFAKLRASGIKAIGVLNGTPRWARSPTCAADSCPPANPEDFARFAAAAAKRYQADDVAWQVWNEPNLNTAWGPQPDAAGYVSLLKATAPAIREAAPRATVVSAGLSPTGTEPGTTVAPTDYLSDMYRLGARPYFDALGWHPYGDASRFGTYDPTSGWTQMADTPVSARSIMRSNGDENKKIWATEFGVSTAEGQYNEQVQADTLAKAIEQWSKLDFAGPLIIYNYQDREAASGQRTSLYGIVRSDGVAKPALGQIASAVRDVRAQRPDGN